MVITNCGKIKILGDKVSDVIKVIQMVDNYKKYHGKYPATTAVYIVRLSPENKLIM